MDYVEESNTRYQLEVHRRALLQRSQELDREWGLFLLVWLTAAHAASAALYLVVIGMARGAPARAAVAAWAGVGAAAAAHALAAGFVAIPDAITDIFAMLAALGRTYGISWLYIIWFCSGYCHQLAATTSNALAYTLMALPAAICAAFVVYYSLVNTFIVEVYPPGSDIVNATIVFVVTLLVLICWIAEVPNANKTNCALSIMLTNLVINIPACIMDVLKTFVLDISWQYQFHLYFVDFLLAMINCSCPLFVVVILYLNRTYFYYDNNGTKSKENRV